MIARDDGARFSSRNEPTVLQLSHAEFGHITLVRELERIEAYIPSKLAIQVLRLGSEGQGDGPLFLIHRSLVGHVHLFIEYGQKERKA